MHDEQLDRLKLRSHEKPLSRRDFMRVLSIVGTAGPGLAAAGLSGLALTRSQRVEAAQLVVAGLGKLPRRKFGTRMGDMTVPAICMAQDWNRELFAPALELGINFIHKAGYWNSVEAVPAEIRKLPRESYYTDITVDNTSPGHNPDNYDEAYGQVTGSLSRNGLKYYDVYRAHYGWQNPAAFKSSNEFFNTSYKAFQRLKKEGKVRYFAVSQHPYVPYPEIIGTQIESGIISAMQVWYSIGKPKEDTEIFAKASKAGIGMTAMKINAHGRDKIKGDTALMEKLKAPGQPGRALLRAVMTTKREDGKAVFHTCVSALGNLQMFEENIGGLSKAVALRDGFDGYDTILA